MQAPCPTSTLVPPLRHFEAAIVGEACVQRTALPRERADERPEFHPLSEPQIRRTLLQPFNQLLHRRPVSTAAFAAEPPEQLEEEPILVKARHVPLAGAEQILAALPRKL